MHHLRSATLFVRFILSLCLLGVALALSSCGGGAGASWLASEAAAQGWWKA